MVWLQDPSLTSEYKAIGINTFVGIWDGPTQAQIDQFANSGVWVVSSQNSLAVADNPPSFVAWAQPDEPDNAQPASRRRLWTLHRSVGPAGQLSEVDHRRSDAAYLPGIGPGGSLDRLRGQGELQRRHFDVPRICASGRHPLLRHLPVNEEGSNSDDPAAAGNLWYVAQGVDNLRGWVNDKKTGLERHRDHDH